MTQVGPMLAPWTVLYGLLYVNPLEKGATALLVQEKWEYSTTIYGSSNFAEFFKIDEQYNLMIKKLHLMVMIM